MKKFFKSILLRYGIQLNLTKNLWYKDSYFLLKKFMKIDNPVIFDVGACDGSTIYEFKQILPLSIIHSFEPFPESYENLVKVSHKFKDVHTYQIALSNTDTKDTFYVNKSKATNSLLKPTITKSFIDEHAIPEKQIIIQQRTLDDFILENNIVLIDILKLDVQGSELMVLQGAKNALSQNCIKYIYAEIWFLEGYENQPLYHDIASYLANFGYKPFGIYNIHYREDGHFLWGDAIFYLN